MEIEISKDGKASANLDGKLGQGAPSNSQAPAEGQDNVKTFVLPSGKVAVMRDFKGKHVREAQRQAGGEPDKLLFTIIALTTEIDGKAVIMEELDEMDGMDVFALYGQFVSKPFTLAPSK